MARGATSTPLPAEQSGQREQREHGLRARRASHGATGFLDVPGTPEFRQAEGPCSERRGRARACQRRVCSRTCRRSCWRYHTGSAAVLTGRRSNWFFPVQSRCPRTAARRAAPLHRSPQRCRGRSHHTCVHADAKGPSAGSTRAPPMQRQSVIAPRTEHSRHQRYYSKKPFRAAAGLQDQAHT